MDILADLYDNLENDPRNILTRELILDAWIQIGDQDMAMGIAKEIQQLDPTNASAKTFLSNRRVSSSTGGSGPSQAPPQPPPAQPVPLSIRGKNATITLARMPRTEQDRAAMEQAFQAGYADVRSRAALLLGEMRALQTVGRLGDDDGMLEDLQHLVDGRLSAAVARPPPRPVRDLARSLSSSPPTAALDLIIADFEEVLDWTLAASPSAAPDALRQRLVARQTLLEAAVPPSLAQAAKQALTHVEHERLRRLPGSPARQYANTETMLGDDVSAIPRANLLVTEDNYAWDMAELAAALAANGGVMRNPLTRAMFSPDDVRAVLRHPLGARLAPLRLEQGQLRRGVRPATVERLAAVAAAMLADQSADAAPSMAAVDEFLTYVAGLPAAEQRTLDELKIPAVDSHTGIEFDYTVGESVRDAKANRTCFHKTGDFLGQAAKYLQRS